MFIKGHKSWCKGLTKGTDERVAKRAKNIVGHPGWTKGKAAWNKGLTKENDSRVKKTSVSLKCRPSSRKGKNYEEIYGIEKAKEISLRIGKSNSIALLGNTSWSKGLTKETDSRILARPNQKGEKSPGWRGGISKEPYPFEFDKELRELVKQRDNYTCQLCNTPECECLLPLGCHHINYNKRDCSPRNLITLCRKCNSKVNGNRKYWEEYFSKMLSDYCVRANKAEQMVRKEFPMPTGPNPQGLGFGRG